MTTKKIAMLLFIIFVLIFIGLDLSPIFKKKSLTDISFSDFRISIGPFLSAIAVFISYRIEVKKEKNAPTQNHSPS